MHTRPVHLAAAALLTVLLGACGESPEEKAQRLEYEKQQQLARHFEGKSLGDWIYQLENDDFFMRRASAARELGQLGEDARLAVPSLLAALEDEHRRVRQQAALALGNLGPDLAPGAREALLKLKKTEEDEDVQDAVSTALDKLGSGS